MLWPSALHALSPTRPPCALYCTAGFWAAATAAFNRSYGLTTFREQSRWKLLLLWPFLLLTSAEFRQQWWAAVRGQRVGPAAAKGQAADGEQFMA